MRGEDVATVKMTVTVCDVCEDQSRGTRHYGMTSEGRKIGVDLCDEHGRPVEHLFGDPRELDALPPPVPTRTPVKRAAKKATAKKATARRSPSMGAKVTTLSEIEATKRGKK